MNYWNEGALVIFDEEPHVTVKRVKVGNDWKIELKNISGKTFWTNEDYLKKLADIEDKKHVANIVIPTVGESGRLSPYEPYYYGETLSEEYPNLMEYYVPELEEFDHKFTGNLDTAPPEDLWLLSQMAHPKDYGFYVPRYAVLSEWEKESRGKEAVESLGFPTDISYPYKNRHSGSISSLGMVLGSETSYTKHRYSTRYEWWHVIESWFPIKNIDLEIKNVQDDILLYSSYIKKCNKKSHNSILNSLTWTHSKLISSLELLKGCKNNTLPKEIRTSRVPKTSLVLDLLLQ